MIDADLAGVYGVRNHILRGPPIGHIDQVSSGCAIGQEPHHELIRQRPLLSKRRVMKSVRDCFGWTVRLTDERMAHVLQHPEMAGMEQEIERVLESPGEVRVSQSDDTVQLFYEFYAQTRVGGKWLCVVVKYPPNDGFMVRPI